MTLYVSVAAVCWVVCWSQQWWWRWHWVTALFTVLRWIAVVLHLAVVILLILAIFLFPVHSCFLGVCGFWFDFAEILQFSVQFRFYKINCSFSFFWFVFCSVCCILCVLCTLLVAFQLTVYWIGPTNCQLKWLRFRSAEIQHEEKILWLLIPSCWKMNYESDSVKNCPQTAKVIY